MLVHVITSDYNCFCVQVCVCVCVCDFYLFLHYCTLVAISDAAFNLLYINFYDITACLVELKMYRKYNNMNHQSEY